MNVTRSLFWACIAIALFAIGANAIRAGAAQSAIDVHSTVSDVNGAPISGVTVWSNPEPGVKSAQSWSTETGADGAFALERVGDVLYLTKEKYEPLAVVITGKPFPGKFVMQASSNDFVLHPCGAVPAGERGFGGLELRFAARTKGVEVLGGKPDADYVKWVLRPKSTAASVELWFGIYAMSLRPPEEQLIGAESFSMRNVVLENAAAVGIDAVGTAGGGRWRQFSSIGAGGARYKDATNEEAKLFDAVIDSACGSMPEQK
jgi:hypothetical protein